MSTIHSMLAIWSSYKDALQQIITYGETFPLTFQVALTELVGFGTRKNQQALGKASKYSAGQGLSHIDTSNSGLFPHLQMDGPDEIVAVYYTDKAMSLKRAKNLLNICSALSFGCSSYCRFCLQQTHRATAFKRILNGLQQQPIKECNKNLKAFSK